MAHMSYVKPSFMAHMDMQYPLRTHVDMHTLACRYWVFVNEWLSLRVDALSRRSGRLVGVKLVCDMREADPLKQFRFCWLRKMRFVDLY